MRLLVVRAIVHTRAGHHAYTQAHADDKHYAQRDSLSPSYYPSSWVSHELPYQAHRLDPVGALEQDSEECIKCGGSLLPHLRHDISFMSNHPLGSIQSGLGRNGGAGSENMDVENGGFSATLKGPAVCIKSGRSWGQFCWDRFKTCSQFNTRLSGQNRKSSRGARANGHVGNPRTSAVGPSIIEPSSKRKIPVTRDDGDESML